MLRGEICWQAAANHLLLVTFELSALLAGRSCTSHPVDGCSHSVQSCIQSNGACSYTQGGVQSTDKADRRHRSAARADYLSARGRR